MNIQAWISNLALPVKTYTPERQQADAKKFLTLLNNPSYKKEAEEFEKQAQAEKWVGTEFKEINILLLGKTRAGKTTLAKVLQSLFHLAGKPTLFRGTVDPGILRVEIRIAGKNYRIQGNRILNFDVAVD